MYPPVFAVCYAANPVKALLGTAPMRLFLFGEAEQGTQKPYAVWQVISGVPENFLNQAPDTDSFTIQIDIYADTAASARNVAAALRNAIEPHAHVSAWRGESRDPETKDYRFLFEIDWIVQR